MPTFDEHFAADKLDQHFEALMNGHFDVIEERPRLSIGSDRIELDLFLRDRQKHLAAMSRKVIEGRYTFSPFLEHEIPKADSSAMRTISISSIRDSIVQRALYHYSYDGVDRQLTEAVFGYRRGRSAHAAIRSLFGHITDGRVFVFDAMEAGSNRRCGQAPASRQVGPIGRAIPAIFRPVPSPLPRK